MISLKNIKKNAVIQHDSSDCGAACLASVINCCGGTSSIENIRRLSGTDHTGTTLLGLYKAANQCGFDATGYEAGIEDVQKFDGVLIMHVRLHSSLEHYIVNFGYKNDKFIIWDPAEGLRFMTTEELEKIWISKKCLGLIKNQNFIHQKEDKTSKRDWLKSIIRPDINLFIVSFIAGILFSALGLVLAIFTQKLVDRILPQHNINILIINLILVFILLIARILLGSLRQLLLLSQSRDFNIRVVDNFFGTLLVLPKSFFDTRKTGDFIARLNDTARIQRVIAEILSVYTIDVLIVLISIAILFYYSVPVGIFSLVFSPFLFLIVYRWNGRILSGQREVMVKYANSESFYIDSLKGINEIKSSGWQKFIREKNKKIFSEFQDKYYLLGKIKISLGLITGIMGSIYVVMVIFYGSYEVINSKNTTGGLMAIISISSGIIPSLLNISLMAIPVNEAKVAVSRMFEFTKVNPEENERQSKESEIQIDNIRLNNISFRFPGQKLLLYEINILIQKGKVTTLIGESGGGKSTLANILMRFYRPETGNILVNGASISDCIALEEWRADIGYIPQEIHIFNGTILQNLIPDLDENKVIKIIKLIRDTRFEGFFDAFPSGIMTIVGEEGINLSGGQKQVTGLFRALATSPQFLIIDEGTANMDIETENKVTELIEELKKTMGILMITHKVHIARKLSDDIYVLDNGKINGYGSHEKLLSENEIYKKLWRNFL